MDAIEGPSAQYSSYLQPFMIAVAGIIGASLAIVIYHILLQRFCFSRQPMLNRADTINSQDIPISRSPFKNGVDQEILDKIPILSYSTKKPEIFRLHRSECAICLGELQDGELVRLLPPCKHAFHISCIDGWFTAHSDCPICRSPITCESIEASAPEINGPERPSQAPCLQIDHQFLRDLSASTSRFQSEGGFLRHSVSITSQMEKRPRALVMGLKRSLSMDQSYISITIQKGEQEKGSSSSGKGVGIKYFRARSPRDFDYTSCVLARSFSPLQSNRSATSSNRILLQV
ncbi:hypothetical protein L6164_033761 [Bauhinia variegata]|uniref:Uncharacterized protein n=1 Tax=Bauhinia variegata TaxID=167791 RepID=A0ACB9KT71_BAUVA|nr:hypothetical protein L6164_033761 [Bauhinia variegata]